MKVGRKPKYPEKSPDDELENMSHCKVRKVLMMSLRICLIVQSEKS